MSDSKQSKKKVREGKLSKKSKIVKDSTKENSVTKKTEGKTNKLRKSKLFLVVVVISVVLIIGLAVLAFVQPVIEVEKDIERNEFKNTVINSQADYPIFKSGSGQKLVFSNGKIAYGKDYESKKVDFEEGENTVEVSYYLDLFFTKFEGEKKVDYEFFVDRIGPELKLETDLGDKIYFVEDKAFFEFSSEVGSTLFLDGEEIGVFTENKESFELPVVSGQNFVKVYAEDEYGNKSETADLSFEGLQLKEYDSKDGFKTKIYYPEGWGIDVEKGGDFNKNMNIVFKKGGVILEYDFFGLIYPTGFVPTYYCTNNKDILYPAENGFVRFKTYDLTSDYELVYNNRKFVYKDGFDYSQIEHDENAPEKWFVIGEDWGEFYYEPEERSEKDRDGFAIDYENSADDYNFCVDNLIGGTKVFEHGFKTEGSTPVAWYGVTVEFEDGVDENLLKEADMIVGVSQIGE